MNGAAAIKDPSGGGDSWGTPIDLWQEIYARYFDGRRVLDPCPNRDRLLPGADITLAPTDGLEIDWDMDFFVNPPWSNIMPWAFKAYSGDQFGALLVPVRSDQRWFRVYAPAARLVLIGGRVNYINPKTGTTQVIDKKTGKLKNGGISCPSCLLIFGSVPGVEYWTPKCHEGKRTRAPLPEEAQRRAAPAVFGGSESSNPNPKESAP